MFLSHPGTVTSASYHCAPITVSNRIGDQIAQWQRVAHPLSAHRGAHAVDADRVEAQPRQSAACTPVLTSAASQSRCMFRCCPSAAMLQMPTCGFCRSASVRPMPVPVHRLRRALAAWLGSTRGVPVVHYTNTGLEQLYRVQERHHVAQLRADDLHRNDPVLLAHPLEVGQPVRVSSIHFFANSPVDLLEQLPHRCLKFFGRHDARAGGIIAVFRRVADRVRMYWRPPRSVRSTINSGWSRSESAISGWSPAGSASRSPP